MSTNFYKIEKITVPKRLSCTNTPFSLTNADMFVLLNNENIQNSFNISNVNIEQQKENNLSYNLTLKIYFNDHQSFNKFNDHDLLFITKIANKLYQHKILIFNEDTPFMSDELNDFIKISCLEYLLYKELTAIPKHKVRVKSNKF